jgi:uncharacterized protein YfiM (DUF2279 family)
MNGFCTRGRNGFCRRGANGFRDAGRDVLGVSWNLGKIKRSEDRGVAWSDIATRSLFCVLSGGQSVCASPGPVAVASGTPIAFVGNDTWFAVLGAEIWTSEDKGSSWVQKRAYNLADGVVRSLDGGESWVSVDATRTQYAVSGCGSGIVLAGGVYGAGSAKKWRISRSANNGATWADVAERATGTSANVRVMGIRYIGAGVMIAVVRDSSVAGLILRSTNYGATWASVKTIGVANDCTVLSATVCLATDSTKIWRSADAGATWSSVHSGSTLGRVRKVSAKIALAQDTSSVTLRSVDGGVNWNAISPSYDFSDWCLV